MRRNSRTSVSREKLRVLYIKARAGDELALALVLRIGTRELRRWLSRRFSARCIRAFYGTELAEEALEDAILRIDRIPSWAHAWAYARKTLKRRVMASRIKRPCCETSLAELLDAPDPRSDSALSEIDLREALLSELLGMTSDELRIAISVVSGVPPLDVLSRELSVSIRTLNRRRRDLRRRLLSVLRNL